MAMELVHFSQEVTRGTNDPLNLMILLSFVKDDLPWLYELGVDAYHQIVQGKPKAKEALERVFSALKMLHRGPWIEMFENKETFMLLHELEHFLDFSGMREYESKNARHRAPTTKIGPGRSKTEGAR